MGLSTWPSVILTSSSNFETFADKRRLRNTPFSCTVKLLIHRQGYKVKSPSIIDPSLKSAREFLLFFILTAPLTVMFF